MSSSVCFYLLIYCAGTIALCSSKQPTISWLWLLAELCFLTHYVAINRITATVAFKRNQNLLFFHLFHLNLQIWRQYKGSSIWHWRCHGASSLSWFSHISWVTSSCRKHSHPAHVTAASITATAICAGTSAQQLWKKIKTYRQKETLDISNSAPCGFCWISPFTCFNKLSFLLVYFTWNPKEVITRPCSAKQMQVGLLLSAGTRGSHDAGMGVHDTYQNCPWWGLWKSEDLFAQEKNVSGSLKYPCEF